MSQSGRRRVHIAACRPDHSLDLVFVIVALASILAVLLPATAALAASYTFTPVADGYTRSDAATTSYSSSKTTSARNAATQKRRTYMRFNVAVPAGQTISRATLTVYSGSGGTNVDLRDVASDSWSESGLTWNRAPAFSSMSASRAASVARGRTTSLDATGIVTGGGPASMALTTTSSTTVSFNTREASRSTRPKLVVVTAPNVIGAPPPVLDPVPAPPPPPPPPPADTTPPDTTITSSPDSPTTATTASFSFTGADDTTASERLSFQCSYDGGSYQTCSSIKTYSPVAAGAREFAVRAVDASGNVDPSPAQDTWQVEAPADTTPPSAPPVTLGGVWAWDARTAPLDPNSASMAAKVAANAADPNLAMTDWAVATADAKSGDPDYTIPRSDQGGSITLRIPLGTRPDPSGDGHLTVRDVERGVETDFWQARYDSTTRRISTASAAITFPLGSVSAGSGWTGNAANTPLRRGLITPEDLKAAIDSGGSLPYTLQFGIPNIAQGSPRWPAVHNVPTGNFSSVVEGTWIRLDPTYDVEASTLPAWQKVIARTLQTKGAINRDNSGTLSFYGRNPLNGEAQWSVAGLSGGSAGFSSAFPWNRIQVVVPPAK